MISATPARAAWVILDRSGAETICTDRAEWLAEWRHRVRAIEQADRPVHLRRAGLERLLEANAGIFLTLAREGGFDAAVEASVIIAHADGRLSRLVDACEVAP